MRCLLYLPLAFVLAQPIAAVAGPVDSGAARPVGNRSVDLLPTAARPASAHGATADPPTLCETAATTAEYVNRIPPRLLQAIALTETGRPDPASGRIRPWPWSINAEGEGHFYDTPQQAIAAVKALQARGVQSIDVGCMQVNLAYHPDAFASLEQAFDPRINAHYAARFLNTLYAEGGGWEHAIGAYHSETPALGDAYRVLVMARWQDGDPHQPAPARSAYRDTRSDSAYAAFAPASRVYGAFAPR